MADTAPPKRSGLASFLVDYGPILLLFAVYKYSSPANRGDIILEVAAVIKGTLAFMVGALAAFAFSLIRYKHVPPMPWLSTGLILTFGTMTYFLSDPVWIQIKPTAIYLLFAAVLFGGLFRGKAMLRTLLQSAFDGLSDEGWLKLSRNWAWFFLFLAGLNEVLRHTLSFDTWLLVKLWGVSGLSFLFTFAQIPMLLRHGLGEDAQGEVEQNPPAG